MKMVVEINMQMASHLLYLRKLFPYLDYHNRFLQDQKLEETNMALEAIFYSDTSNLAFQLLAQNSRMLRRRDNYKSINPHHVRIKLIYNVCSIQLSLANNWKRTLLEKLIQMPESDVFEEYRKIAFFMEWSLNEPSNLFLNRDSVKLVRDIYDSVLKRQAKEALSSEQSSLASRLEQLSGVLVSEDQMRHSLLSMNDYVRKNDKIVTAAIDDEMVILEMRTFFARQLRWLERRAESVIEHIAQKEVEVIVKYLHTELLEKYKEKSLDYHYFTFAKLCNCVVLGGTSTFHEFLQPLIETSRGDAKLRVFNYLRVGTTH